MATILLFGVAANSNWLPFIYPFAVVAVVGWAVQKTVRFIRERRKRRNVDNVGNVQNVDNMDNAVI